MKTKDMVLIAMFTALTAIGAQLSLPTNPVPFTLQVLFCMYSGILLGAKRGAISQIIYVALGLIGLPIFAGAKGGPGMIVSPTFGYLLGFIACSFVAGLISEKFKSKNIIKLLVASLGGLAVVYIIGVPYLYIILNNVVGVETTISGAIKTGFLVFLAQDIVKCIIVAVTSRAIIPVLGRAGYINQDKIQTKKVIN